MSNRAAIPAALLLVLLATACSGAGAADDGSDDGVATLGSSEDSTDVEAVSDDGSGGDGLDEEEFEEALLDYVACLREHGVDAPDPQFEGDGNVTLMIPGPGPGDDPGLDTTFQEAREACGDPPMPEGGFEFSPEDRVEMEDRALEFAQCMRDHGIDVPDPDFSGGAGGPGAAAAGPEEGEDAGPQVRIGPFGGALDPEDPATAAALQECEEIFGGMRFGGGPDGSEGPGGADGEGPEFGIAVEAGSAASADGGE